MSGGLLGSRDARLFVFNWPKRGVVRPSCPRAAGLAHSGIHKVSSLLPPCLLTTYTQLTRLMNVSASSSAATIVLVSLDPPSQIECSLLSGRHVMDGAFSSEEY